MEPEGSLPHSQQPATCPYSKPDKSSPKSHAPFPLLRLYQRISSSPKQLWMFRNMAIFYGEELLAPRPTPKLDDHPLSAVHDRLLIMFAATLHIGWVVTA